MDALTFTGELMGNEAMLETAFAASFAAGGMMVAWIVSILLGIFQFVGQALVFEKGKLPRWGLLIPVYNIYLLFKLAGRSGKLTRWLLFPPVLIVYLIIAQFDIAKRFGKETAFGFGLWLLPVVFYPILAFSKDAVYTPKADQ